MQFIGSKSALISYKNLVLIVPIIYDLNYTSGHEKNGPDEF